MVNGGALITNSVFVPSGSGWVTRSIDLSNPVSGSTTTLSSVISIELVSLQAGAVISVGALDVFVDNIRAVPEPSVAIFGLFAMASLTLRRQRAS